jgi:hypothetical protein
MNGSNLEIKRPDRTAPYLHFGITGNLTLAIGSSDYVLLTSGAYTILKLTAAAGVSLIQGGNVTGDDLQIKANRIDANPVLTLLGGTDKIKFGAYSAGIAGDSTGYILIEDKDGNERKLMVQA